LFDEPIAFISVQVDPTDFDQDCFFDQISVCLMARLFRFDLIAIVIYFRFMVREMKLILECVIILNRTESGTSPGVIDKDGADELLDDRR
jgi:hypothetical protein